MKSSKQHVLDGLFPDRHFHFVQYVDQQCVQTNAHNVWCLHLLFTSHVYTVTTPTGPVRQIRARTSPRPIRGC